MSETANKGWLHFLRMVAVVAAVVLGCVWVWMNYFHTYHFAVVQEGVLYRDGVRTPREFQTAYRKSRFKTDVSLVTAEEQTRPEFQAEEALCRKQGIDLVRIPIAVGGEPTAKDIEQFMAVMSDQSRWPVLVHCAQGVQRTGMMVAVYQQRKMKLDKEQVLDAVLQFGGEERVQQVRAFIDKMYAPAVAPATVQASVTAGQ